MHLGLLLSIFSIIVTVRAVQSSSSSGSFNWRSFLEIPNEDAKDVEKEPMTTELTSREVASHDRKMKESAKKPQIRKEPRNVRYQREKERALNLPHDKEEQIKMRKQQTQNRYRLKVRRETGYSSRKSAYEGELYKLYRMGTATEEQKQELQDIRSQRKVRMNKSAKKRKERMQESKSKE